MQSDAIRQVEIERAYLHAGTAAIHRDRLFVLPRRGDRREATVESGEAFDDRPVLRDRGVTANDERQRFLDLTEGGNHLHQAAELYFF